MGLKKLRPNFFYNRMQLILELSVRGLWLAFFIGAFLFLNKLYESSLSTGLSIFWIVFMFGLSTLMYYRVRHTISIWFCYFLLFAIVFYSTMVGSSLDNSIMAVLMFMMVVSMISHLLACKNAYPPAGYRINWLFVALPILYELYAIATHSEYHYILGFVFAAIFMLGHFWCTYAENIRNFMGESMSLSNVPRSDIYKSNTRVVCVIIALFSFGLLLLFLLRYTEFFSMLGRVFNTPLEFLVNQIGRIYRFFVRLLNSTEEESGTYISEDTVIEDGEPSELFLNIVGFLTFMILLSVVVTWAVLFIIKKRKKKIIINVVIGSSEDEVEDIVPVAKEKKHLFKNNNEKVRYRFKKWIKKTLKPHVPETKTANQLSQIAIRNSFSAVKAVSLEELADVNVEENEDTIKKEQLTGLYDVARYSGRMVTDEELNSVGV